MFEQRDCQIVAGGHFVIEFKMEIFKMTHLSVGNI